MDNVNIGSTYILTAFDEIMAKINGGMIYGTPVRYLAVTYAQKALIVAAYYLGQLEEMNRSIERADRILGK